MTLTMEEIQKLAAHPYMRSFATPRSDHPNIQYGTGRLCDCGTVLSRYNPQGSCSVCVRRAITAYNARKGG